MSALRHRLRAASRADVAPRVSAQWMELQGFIKVDWPAIHAWLGAKAVLLDQNGDGKLDANDAKALAVRRHVRSVVRCAHVTRVKRVELTRGTCALHGCFALQSRFSTVMSTTAPSAAGFIAGFSFGMM